MTDYIEITQEDNMELMARYPDNYFDLAWVDIEFGIGASKPSEKPCKVKQRNGNNLNVKKPNYKPKDWDFTLSSNEYLQELFRVSKNQMIKGGNYYGLIGGYLVWDKLNGECDQFGCELIWTSFQKRTDIVYYLWSGMFQGVCVSTNVRKALEQIGDKRLNEKRIHPTQTPVKLHEWLLKKYAKKGYKILNTHIGSMGDAIAIHNLNEKNNMNLSLVGCELDKDYFESGIKRVKQHIAQKTIFST